MVPIADTRSGRTRVALGVGLQRMGALCEHPIMTDVNPHGLHHVTAIATDPQSNVDFYTRALGLRLVKQTVNFDAPESYHGMNVTAEDGDHAGFGMAGGTSGALVGVLGGVKDRGLQAGGTVHHVAFRAPDLETMTVWQHELLSQGVSVTQILDRQYFKSIYFREPGGVLFEIATDTPGFAVDEPLLELGRHLRLPPWLEPDREQIAAALPPLQLDVDVP